MTTEYDNEFMTMIVDDLSYSTASQLTGIVGHGM
jgi:hypothetical protein